MKKCAVLHACGERKRGKLFLNGIKPLKISPKSMQRQGRRAASGYNSAMKPTDKLHSAVRRPSVFYKSGTKPYKTAFPIYGPAGGWYNNVW